jgi:outer membrane protein OmpA-like peptidoglycan-associated protein
MTRHPSIIFFFGCLVSLFLVAPSATAQNYRAEESLYLKGRVGLNTYGGDRDDNPDNELSEYIDNIGFSLGAEIGYHLNKRFSVGLMHLSGDYPKVSDPRPDVPPPLFREINVETSSDWRHHLNLLGRLNILPQKRANPYVHLGLTFGLGKLNDSYETGFGPMGGIGLDVAVNDRVGLFLEVSSMYILDDEALDLADPTAYSDSESVEDSDVSDFDAFNFYGIGVRYNFERAFTPVDVLSIDCPPTLIVDESGTFTATVNEDATPPVSYTWGFGDGTEASGLIATHAFDEAGSYTVTFTADNGGSTASQTCSVRVIAPARITTVTADPVATDTCEPMTPVQFSANVRGTAPIDYSWDFGDGSTGTGATPSHTYSQPGTYTVTLTARNEAGGDERSITVTVEPCPADCDIEDMNSVFFDRNSSVLTEQARQALQDNLEIFQDCPTLCAMIEGFASMGERNPQRLAEDRARAVQQFYIDGGLDADRFATSGSVLQQTKKDASQLRRADTLPTDCAADGTLPEDMDQGDM